MNTNPAREKPIYRLPAIPQMIRREEYQPNPYSRAAINAALKKEYARQQLVAAEEERLRQNRIRHMKRQGENLRLKFAQTMNNVKFVNNHGEENLNSMRAREARIAGSPFMSKGGKKKTRKAGRRTRRS